VNSCLYQGRVSHARLEPTPHTFSYPVYFLGIDLDELPSLPERVRAFGYNQRRLFAIHDRDYLDDAAGSIREKLRRFLKSLARGDEVTRIFMVTAARFMNYVFNPVTFYYGYGADGLLRCAVAEVNNTFRERHLYLLDNPAFENETAHFHKPKAFHVSPFNDLKGEYAFSFSPPLPALDVHVDLIRDGRVVFKSQLAGKALPLDTKHLAGTLARYPLAAALTMPRIMTQAAQLYFRKKLPVFTKPAPLSEATIRVAPPTAWERVCARLTLDVLGRMERGTLDLTLPDGSRRRLGGAAPGPAAEVRIRDNAFFARTARDGEIGLGDGYMLGEWDTPDITSFISLLIENRHRLDDGDVRMARVGRALNRALHLARPNTRAGSRRNISAHYDLSNDFFKLWLDPTLMYSAAVYAHAGQSLQDAQVNKIRRLIQAARIGPEHHVLEIGSGWGGFALEAARTTGCRVTSITVSQRQLEEAQARAAAAGLADRVTFELRDYRNVEGRFDRIVSIEMLEAVGRSFLGTYFSALDRALKPDGLAAIQVITIPDQRYEAYSRSVDWIQKHIFPGGHLPSLGALCAAMTAHSSLHVESVENIGPHYAPTLRAWRDAFEANLPDIRALGYDEVFIRKWRYYLAYCEAAFATRALDNLHLVLTRTGNPSLRLAY
jgi:cyclopropane-fatty-acyl-phospholipid synthase